MSEMAMVNQRSRELTTFPIAPSIILKFTRVGLSSVDDVHDLKPSELSREAKLTLSEALEVLETVFEDSKTTSVRKVIGPKPRTAWELLQQEQNTQSIVTFCEPLDDLLGGGVPLAKITEICGAPGVGKTQLCLQLAVDAHIPVAMGGVQGEAVYIDTEGSFIVDRLVDIASATLEHCQEVNGQNIDLGDLSLEGILSSIHYYRVHDYTELVAVVHLLPRLFQQNSKIKLVVVDSVACPFRQGFDDMSARTRVLSTLTQNLIRLATQFECAVVLTNQMTTKITSGSSHLVPALGESWGHACTHRLILHWVGSQRKALLYKSPDRPEATCCFQVTHGGIRAAVEDDRQTSKAKQREAGSTDEDARSHAQQKCYGAQDCVTILPPAKRSKLS